MCGFVGHGYVWKPCRTRRSSGHGYRSLAELTEVRGTGTWHPGVYTPGYGSVRASQNTREKKKNVAIFFLVFLGFFVTGADDSTVGHLRHRNGGGPAKKLRALHGVPGEVGRRWRGGEAPADPAEAAGATVRGGVQVPLEPAHLLSITVGGSRDDSRCFCSVRKCTPLSQIIVHCFDKI